MKRTTTTTHNTGAQPAINEALEVTISESIHGVALIGKDYMIQNFNPRFGSCFSQITGTSARRGLSVINTLFPENREQIVPLFEQVLDKLYSISNLRVGETDYGIRLEPALDRQNNTIGVFLYLTNKKDNEEGEFPKEPLNFQKLLETSGDAVVIFSPDAKLIYASPSVELILGYSEQEIMHIDIYSKIHPDDLLENQKVVEKAIFTPGIPIKGFRSRILHKDGTYHLYDSTIVNLINDPSIGGLVDNIKEVVELPVSNNADSEFKTLYASAIEDSKIGIWEIDLEAGKSVRTRVHDQIFGYAEPLAQWDFATLLQHIHYEDQVIASEIFDLAKTEGVFDFEVRIIWPDQSIHWITMKGTCTIGTQTNRTKLSGSVVDITERRANIQALLNSESRLKGIINHMSEGLIVGDKTGRLLYWNKAAVEMHGFTSMQSPPKNFMELLKYLKFEQLNGKALPISKWPLSRLLNNEKVDHTEVRIQSIKHQWVKIFRYNGGSFADSEGNQVYFLMISDKTEINNIKKHLRESEERFLDAFHASPVALCITSSKGAFCLEINKSAEELLGFSYEEYTGKSILELNGVPKTDIKNIFDQKGGAYKPSESRLLISTKKGQKRMILFSVEQITLNGEECRLTLFLDITHDKSK